MKPSPEAIRMSRLCAKWTAAGSRWEFGAGGAFEALPDPDSDDVLLVCTADPEAGLEPDGRVHWNLIRADIYGMPVGFGIVFVPKTWADVGRVASNATALLAALNPKV